MEEVLVGSRYLFVSWLLVLWDCTVLQACWDYSTGQLASDHNMLHIEETEDTGTANISESVDVYSEGLHHRHPNSFKQRTV